MDRQDWIICVTAGIGGSLLAAPLLLVAVVGITRYCERIACEKQRKLGARL